LANSAGSVKLFDFQGEDSQFSLAEMQSGSIAATVGGEGAAIYSSSGIQKLKLIAAFPIRLLESGPYLISLDNDGNISWYDNHNGKPLAVFRLYPGGWSLQTEQGTTNGWFYPTARPPN
jgi:hypothetical protein